MTTSIIAHGRIETTETRAKELRKLADKMITLGKRGDLHARRQALSFIYDKNVVAKLFEEIAPKYEGRNGGYTRILKLGPRRGDGAEMVIIELV
jgi:large subunit ribosomal protein L17